MMWARLSKYSVPAVTAISLLAVASCSSRPDAPLVETQAVSHQSVLYLIGPGDSLNISVYGNPDLSSSVPVRPDGRISMPLVPDLLVSGLTPSQVADKVKVKISEYVKDAAVTVMVTTFKGALDQQIRVVGEAAKPQALQYTDGLTVLDAMIQVGGLTQFAAGNRTILIRHENGKDVEYRVRLDDLLRGGEMSANAPLRPGDTLVIPQSWF